MVVAKRRNSFASVGPPYVWLACFSLSAALCVHSDLKRDSDSDKGKADRKRCKGGPMEAAAAALAT